MDAGTRCVNYFCSPSGACYRTSRTGPERSLPWSAESTQSHRINVCKVKLILHTRETQPGIRSWCATQDKLPRVGSQRLDGASHRALVLGFQDELVTGRSQIPLEFKRRLTRRRGLPGKLRVFGDRQIDRRIARRGTPVADQVGFRCVAAGRRCRRRWCGGRVAPAAPVRQAFSWPWNPSADS